ncbi:MAG: ParB/RepB/Spo0J family partition protein [Clostridia bacterium]|nr:ParB/RepB/Spo0J family partition protein [Clostridia bacterium]
MKDRRIVYLKLSEIKKSRTPLRASICPYELKKLAASIKALGIIEPLIVRVDEQGEYELISGNRRLAAAREAGLSRLPCIIKKADSLPAYLWAICENTQRKNLTPFEEAEALERLISLYDLNADTAAEELGISPSAYSFKLALLSLNVSLRKRMETAELGERYARLLLQIPEELRESTLDKIIAEELCFADAKSLIEEILSPPKSRFVKKAIGDIRLFSNSLNKMVDTMKMGGINAVSEKNETDSHIEYKVTITK